MKKNKNPSDITALEHMRNFSPDSPEHILCIAAVLFDLNVMEQNKVKKSKINPIKRTLMGYLRANPEMATATFTLMEQWAERIGTEEVEIATSWEGMSHAMITATIALSVAAAASA